MNSEGSQSGFFASFYLSFYQSRIESSCSQALQRRNTVFERESWYVRFRIVLSAFEVVRAIIDLLEQYYTTTNYLNYSKEYSYAANVRRA